MHERCQIIRKIIELVIDTKPLKDYVVLTDEEPHNSIVHTPIATIKFEIKPSLVGMAQQNQLSWLPTQNPNLHLSIFVEFCGLLIANGINQNTI